MPKFPDVSRHPFRACRRKTRVSESGPKEMAIVRRVKEERGKNSQLYQEERWKFAEKVAFCLARMYFGRKSKSNVGHFRGVKLRQKHAFLMFMANKLN